MPLGEAFASMGVSEVGSDALVLFAVSPEPSDPVPGAVVSLASHWPLAFRRGWVDTERTKYAAYRGGSVNGELLVKDPYRLPTCDVEPLLPAGVPEGAAR